MRSSDNPFRTGRLGALAFRPQGTDWPALLEKLASLNYRGAFVGGEGSGKTAALEELERRLSREGWRVVSLRAEFRQRWASRVMLEALRAAIAPHETHARVAVLLDSAEQLGWPGWKLFQWHARRAGALIVATHLPGRLPTLHACQTSPSLLGELVGELVGELAPESTAPGVLPSSASLETLWRRHDANLRHALLELYDRWADSPRKAARAKTSGPIAADSPAGMR